MSRTPLPLLYRDEHYVAVDKPSGLLVHRSAISRDESFALQRVRDQLGQHVYTIHRLDRATSGVLLFGLSSAAARQMCDLFATRAVAKRYLAIVRGFAPSAITVERPVREEEGGSYQAAVTHFRTLATVELPIAVPPYASARYSLVEAHPESGRRHQIRKHLRDINHPVIGDVNYGDRHHNHMYQQQFLSRRLLLMARTLSFAHPYTGALVRLEAPVAPEVVPLLTRFGWAGMG